MAGVEFCYFETTDLSDEPHLPPIGLLRSSLVGYLIWYTTVSAFCPPLF
jgi:hypothetical protein